jgi:hypothetical protein
VIYVVLGMHKSGTTLVSQILHHSGVNMGGPEVETGRSYDEGNKYEREDTKAVNEEILGSLDKFSLDIVPPERLPVPSAEMQAEMRAIVAECDSAWSDWGFKDPRTYLTYPLWQDVLPEHRVIVVFRRPDEMWRRYRPRNPLMIPIRACQLMKRWCECYGRILDYLETTRAPSIVLGYRRLMTTNAEFERLEGFVGAKLKDQRQPSLYRGRSKNYPALWTAERLVRRWAGMDLEQIAARFEAIIADQIR